MPRLSLQTNKNLIEKKRAHIVRLVAALLQWRWLK
jgi:hypothetical protein